jgi:hypothetical protein
MIPVAIRVAVPTTPVTRPPTTACVLVCPRRLVRRETSGAMPVIDQDALR